MSAAQRGWSCDMVQPAGCPGGDCGMMGDDASLGKAVTLHLPAELAGHEIVQHFLAENRDLKEAIQQSNRMLRERYQEFLEFQTSHKEEKEFLMCRFQEARAVVENLHCERARLKTELEKAAQKVEYLETHQTGFQPSLPKKDISGAQEESDTVTLIQEDSIPALVHVMSHQKEEELEGNLRALQKANQALQKEKLALQAEICTLQKAAKMTIPKEESEIKIKENGLPVEQPLELEFLQGSGDSRRLSGDDQSEQLYKKLKDAEDERESLQQQLASAQGDLAHLAAQEQETQQQLQILHKQLEQVVEDKASLKAQVTSLLGELRESQSRLESCTQEEKELEERVRGAGERLQQLEREAENRAMQHSIQVDDLRLTVQNLESALRVERKNATEEKRKLAQLQLGYHQLFQEYDAHIKANLENEKRSKGLDQQAVELSHQLQQAEEALVAKQELIDKLKEEAEQHKTILETVPVLKAQAEIYKTDFLAERQAREKLHGQKEVLMEQFAQLQKEHDKLKADAEGTSRMEEMKNRHSELRPQSSQPVFLMGAAPFHHQHIAGPRQSIADEQPDYCCPKCQYRAPDMDTLQIHVMDCIQ